MRKHEPFLGNDLNALSAEEPIRKDRMAISASTSLKEAAEFMDKNQLVNLPVEKSGPLTKTVMRLDLVRILL